MASEEQLLNVLKVKRGSVNGFALANDTEKLVKYYMIDKNLMEHDYWAFHPMRSDYTFELKRDDFVNKFVKDFTGRVLAEVELDDSKVEASKTQDKPKDSKKPTTEGTLLKITTQKNQNLSDWYA